MGNNVYIKPGENYLYISADGTTSANASRLEFRAADEITIKNSIYELNNNLYFSVPSGSIYLGDGTPANLELGAVGTAVDIGFIGGGTITSNGNSLDVGVSGDTINLDVTGVTYGWPTLLARDADVVKLTTNQTIAGIKTFSTAIVGSITGNAATATNADTLDTLHAASFARVDSASTFTTIPAFNGGTSGSTAPFTVDSTQVVTNLNADLLDGQHGSYYQPASTAITTTNIGSQTVDTADKLTTPRLFTVTDNDGTNSQGASSSFDGSSAYTIKLPSTIKASITGTASGNLVPTSTYNLGTTAITFNRASAAQALTGISIDGSAGSLKSTATTGLITITGPTAGQTRSKTVRDAADTILELGGSYTPTGT